MSDFQDYDGEVVPLSADNQDISDLINRIRGVESGGNANAVSSQGAKGSMQIMPGTFKQYALDGESFDNDADRTAAATRKILDDYQYFGGDKAKTAAAYIGGRGAIRKDGSIRDDVTDAYGTSPASYIGKVFGTQDFVPYDGDIIPLSKAGAGRGMVNPKTEDIQKAIASDQKPEQGLWDKVGDTLNNVRDFARSIGTSDYDDTYDNRRSVNPMEAAGRAVTSGSANIAKQALLVSAGAPVLFDKAFGTNTADYVFSNIAKVDDIIRRNDIKPEEKQSTISKVSTAVSNMLPDLALMVATSGESALTKAGTSLVPEAVSSGKIILQALTNGMDFAKPVIVKAFSNSYEKSLNEGKSQSDAMNDALIDSAKTWATLSIPISMVGAPAQRMATGFGMGALQSEAERGAHNVMHPDQQIPYDPDNMVVGGVTNAILARTMGHDYPTFKAPNRSEMGYGYKTPIADSIQKAYNSPERSEYGSQRPENADVLRPVEKTPEQKTADIQSARNVDEAITAAKDLPTVQVPEGEAATQMFSVRPLREVTQEPRTETPVTEKPAVEPPDIESRRVSLEDLDAGLRKQGIYPPAVLDRARLDAEVRHDDLLDRQAYSDEALRRIATAPDAGPDLTNAAIRALRARGEELTPAEVKTLEVKPLEQKPLEPVQGVIQPGSQLDVLHRALAEDFERLYQQDIKNDIKRRLRMEPEQADQPTSSPFKSFLREYGIQPSLAADITGERGLRANNVLPRTFRKDGLNLDALVEKAVERGFMHADEVHSDADNGGTNRLVEMIKAEIRGNRQLPVDRMQEDAQAQHDRVQRLELEHEADRLGLQYPTGLESAKLASMVARVHRRLEEARAPTGSTKEQRIIRAAQEANARIEAERARLEAANAEFDALRVAEQDAILDVLMDENGMPVIVKRSAVIDERYWDANQSGKSDARATEDSGEAGASTARVENESSGLAGQERGEAQHQDHDRTGQSQEGLTAPTRAEVLADQNRRANAEALDRREQIKRESEAGAGLFQLTTHDGRPDTTGSLFANESTANYSHGYEKDLFGNPLPDNTGSNRSSRPEKQTVRRVVSGTPKLFDTPTPDGKYYVNTSTSVESKREVGTSVVNTPDQAAKATSYLYRSAVERFDAIVTDASGKVLAVVGGFKGAISQASIYPGTIVSEAVRVPGAAHIWFSHNHPSGSSELSRADMSLSNSLADVFRGSGIEPMGLLAVAGNRFSYVDQFGRVSSGSFESPKMAKKVPVFERELTQRSQFGEAVSSPQDAKSVSARYYNEQKGSGILLLDSQHNVAAWIPITNGMRGTLRGGELNTIYRAASQANASSAIIVHGGELDARVSSVSASENIAAALAKIDVRPLDSINVKTNRSAAESGSNVAQGPLYSRADRSEGLTPRPSESVAPVSRHPAQTPLYETMRQLSRFEDAFQLRDSRAKDLTKIADEMQSGESKKESDKFHASTGTIEIKGVRKPSLTLTKEGKDGVDRAFLHIVDYNTPTPYVHIGNENIGTDVNGAHAYQIAFAWAHNNGKVMRPDPAGITPINRLRRNEAMISSALHFGTTEHMLPHPDQYVGLTRMAIERGIEPEATNWHENPDMAQELEDIRDKNWKIGNDPATIAFNVDNLIRATNRLIELRAPEAKRFSAVDGGVRENQVDGGVLGADGGSGRALTKEELKSRVSQWAGSGVGESTLSRYAATSTVENALRRLGLHGDDSQGQGMGGVQDVEAVRAIRSALGEVPVAKDSGFHKTLYSKDGIPDQGLNRSTLLESIKNRAIHTASDVESVRAAIQSLTGIVGKDKLGHIVATTSDKIRDTWQPLLDGKLNIESSGDAGKAQAFYDQATNTIFLIADHIRKGDEQAVLAHELMHKWGRQVLGNEGWNRLHSTISGWEKAETHTQEYAVWKYASDKVEAAGKELSTEELFPYAVEGAMKMGIEPSMAAPKGSVARWLESVRQSLKMAWSKITGKPETFKAQDLVDMAFAISRMENPADRESIAGAIERKKDDVSPIGFYSALSRGVDAIKTTAAPAAGWKDAIKGLVNKGLAKADEVEWSGVMDFLDMQGGKVTKQQVIDFLRGNGVQVQEVVLGDEAKEFAAQRWLDERAQLEFAMPFSSLNEIEQDYLRGKVDDANITPLRNTKYGQYTLPGGENYREVLLTLPGLSATAAEIAAAKARELSAKMRKAETDAEYEQLRAERAELAGKAKNAPLYRSSHWDQPNVLAHIRVNDRVDADGKRVLFVEEIQSDFGQDGKKKGFGLTPSEQRRADALSAKMDAGTASESERAEARELGKKIVNPIPAAPFVTKTDAWLNLALKRIIKMAVDEGYDKVAFVNGEQSAARYDLSKQVDSIEWDEAVAMKGGARVSIQLGSGMQTLYVDTKDGNIVRGSGPLGDVAGKSLDDVLGKEIAKKILSSKTGELRDDGLKVGGEGMKAFYDSIVPNAVKKMVGKLGGSGVENVSIDLPKGKPTQYADFNAWKDAPDNITASQTGFTITPAMRDKVADGLPLFSRTNENLEPGRSQISRLIESAINHTSQTIDKAGNFGGKGSAYELLAPMSAGTQKARAVAQEWINNNRVAQYEWQTIDNIITKKFSPAQRRKMYDAGDEENDLRREGIVDPTRGLGRLNPEERNVMEALHQYSKELWQRALDVGMVEGKGVDFWTPRQMAMIDESGKFVRPPGESMGGAKDARNFTATGGGSSKNRKYETSAETEAAMNAMGGTLVRDIRTMPLAMYRFERGIAGRELINQIKDLGLAVGKEFVIGEQRDGYFTLDHPAFTTSKPRMVEVDGKLKPAVDQNGNTIFDSSKLYISSEFRGPLNAILTHDWAGKGAYNGYMLIKSKAMSAIMYSPLIHNQVILGRALAYGGIKTPLLYFSGNAAKGDTEFMKKMIGAGMVPIGNRSSMLDVGDIANGNHYKEGSWTDPNESWIGLGVKAAGNKISKGLGDTLKSGIDYAGDVLHNKLLWDRVGDLQAGIAKDVYTKLKAQGLDENAATTVAAHISNRYAGAIGKENMSEAAHVIANLALFSKSFNAGNVGTVKDALYGLPAGLKAQLMEHSDVASAVKALDFAKHKARIGLVRDLVYAIAITSLVQDWVKRDKGKSFAENVSDGLDGYQKRAAEAWANAQDNPLKFNSYNPYRLSSTWGNEPDKKDRVDMGEQPGMARHEYMRLPTGKVVEDILGWSMHPGETFSKKESPLLRAMQGIATGEKDKYGTPIVPESADTLEKVAKVAKFIASTHIPIDQIQTLRDIKNGHGTELDKDKTIGNFTGLTFSQGHPQGPEGAVMAKTDERVRGDKKSYMEDVRHDVKIGDYDAAYERLEKIGLTPKEIKSIIEAIEKPKPISKQQRTKFNRHANEDERQMMEDLN